MGTVFALGQYWLRHGECISSSQIPHQTERYSNNYYYYHCTVFNSDPTHPKNDELFFLQAIKDWHLGLVVAAITLVDLVLFGVVAALPHALNSAQLVRNQERLSKEEGVSTKPLVYVGSCCSNLFHGLLIGTDEKN